MRRILCLLLLLAATCPCHAQQKPNTLTPKEIADGWILLFDGETTFGWKTQENKEKANKEVQVIDGALACGPGCYLESSSRFRRFELRFEQRKEGKNAPELTLIYGGQGRGGANAMSLGPIRESKGWEKQYVKVEVGRVSWSATEHDGASSKGSSQTDVLEEDWWRLGLTDEKGKLFLRSIKLRPTNMTPLFNGTDLTGWKEFPGKKSKFAVIDNAINVKDGPGDLQTVGKYKDFILQLECKSNGKHLNSGIFFRCRDNEYQNGYECQIRNEFTKEATQKYLIEDYDPKTNKLIGKKEQLFTAVDYGTGAIYRRQPARKQMSKDGEWFGMTIVAHGNHFATWVNGVQVADWTDNRPRSDNARKGCCLNAGHISIQGHDPTTDLSFRNIRIAEFK